MGEPKGAAIWNRTPKPSMRTQGMQEGNNQPEGWAGAAYVESRETPQRPEQAGGMKSAQFNGSIKNGNVKKSTLKSPPAEAMPHGLMDGGKY